MKTNYEKIHDPATLDDRLYNNQIKKCCNCHGQRDGFSRFCKDCKWRYYQMGNPSYRRVVKKAKYKEHRRLAEKILGQALEHDHEGVRYAVSFFERLIEGNAQRPLKSDSENPYKLIIQAPCMDVLETLKDRGVSGFELLTEVTGVYLLYMDRSNQGAWKEWPGLANQIGICLCRYKRSAPRRIKPGEKRRLGQYVLKSLKPLFDNVVTTVAKQKESEKGIKEMMRKNFNY